MVTDIKHRNHTSYSLEFHLINVRKGIVSYILMNRPSKLDRIFYYMVQRGDFMKRFFYFFGWTIFIGFIIYLGVKYQNFLIHQKFIQNIREESSLTFYLVQAVLFSFLFPIIIGIMFRLPKFINEIKQNKQWMFDWIKFIAIGLPSLCILLINTLKIYIPENMIEFIPQTIFLTDSTIPLIAGGVFGYVLIDSLKK